ncbi:sigma-54-dependent transcriptional regulator [Propylenella binzhouense]|uniref:DNA-binding transcriptional regulator NtrC n=1 Tax=Propylenella binzhouense TaxID=2555902 RepID=A0A964T895_9HYPH|nr:sigma-54 dependent transcriptional regulator [Propylenella binzhouense]MYZ50378.1 sigma-54-dependent Fis family transcriptional regulator [Propylenella binzhouense]
MPSRILIVDDDPVQCRILEETVRALGHRTETVASGEAALQRLQRADAPAISAVLLDLVMPGMDGLAVLAQFAPLGIAVPVVVQTAKGGVEAAVSAMRAGACDFVVKPAAPERIRASLSNALKLGALTSEISRMRSTHAGTLTFRDLIGRAPSMERVVDLGERAARSAIPVLIEGESGVGKELVARAIQGSSNRRTKPFVAVNCGAIPENLVESILFGHEKGAFTGATERRIGKFQEAHGGTLFLDEIGELSPDAQVKLLRVLQDGEIDPVGASRPVRVDVRLIAATNRRLVELVADGEFRDDLFYRLNVFPIWVPPLRDRREDIPELARHFLARFAAEEGKPGLAGIAPEALDLLVAYDWPGNIRQLQNAVFRAVVLSDAPRLRPRDFPQIVASRNGWGPPETAGRAAAAPPRAPRPVAEELQRTFNLGRNDWPAQSPTDAPAAGRYGVARLLDERGEVRRFEALEEEVIRFALDHYRGCMSEVARRLGIGRSTLYRKLKDYDIEPERGPEEYRPGPVLSVAE